MDKKLIVPIVTPSGLSTDSESRAQTKQAIGALISSFVGSVDGVLIGGTTGEGIGLSQEQYRILVNIAGKICAASGITAYAGLLGPTERIPNMVRLAHAAGIQNFVLGLNHTGGDHERRFELMRSLFDGRNKAYLYNMPTFAPTDVDFIDQCFSDLRIKGVKDSSSNPENFRRLIEIKEKRGIEVFHGNEKMYGELSDEELAMTDGLIAGNANVEPELLAQFLNSPTDYAEGRQQLHQAVLAGAGIDGGEGALGIEQHILGLKRKLVELGVFSEEQAALLVPRGQLFQTR